MKYRQADPTKETSCKNCIFAIYNLTTQTGCDHNRISNFGSDVIEVYDDDAEFFVINRLCNYYRPKAWNNGEKDIEKAKQESCLSFDILIDINDINEQDLNNIVKNINNLSYPNKKYKIYLFHDNNQTKDQKNLIKTIFNSITVQNFILSVYSDRAEYIDSIISKSKNAYHLLLDKTNINKIQEILEKAESIVNTDLQKYIILDYENILVISNMAYRILYRTLYYTYEKKIEEFINEAKKNKVFIQYQKNSN